MPLPLVARAQAQSRQLLRVLNRLFLALVMSNFNAANSGTYGATSVLISPCIDLRGHASPKISIRYHAYGTDVGEIVAQVSIDGGHTYQSPPPDNALFYLFGDQGNEWHTFTFDLSPYKTGAAFQIRLVASGWLLGDIAFDSIALYNNPGNTCNLSLTTEFLDVSCHGNADGQIYLSPFGNFVAPVSCARSQGATSPYITGLTPGLYTVTATAVNGCSVIATLPVFSPNYLYASSTQTNVLIYGQSTGSATVQPMGGCMPYNYL